jgi:hypothetical protein
MKNNLLKIGSVILVAGLLFTACKKGNSTASSSGSSKLDIGVKADNSTTALTNDVTGGVSGSTLTTQSSSSANVTWTSGMATISRFEFEAKRNDLEFEVTSKKLTTIDLFAPVPASISVFLDTGVYKEIEIRAVLAKDTGKTIPLILKGNYTTSTGTVVPIEIDYNDPAVIKTEVNNVHVDSKTNLSTVITMHLTRLLSHVTAASLDAAVKTNGVIVISNTINRSIYMIIRDNIGSCGEDNGFDRRERHGDD